MKGLDPTDLNIFISWLSVGTYLGSYGMMGQSPLINHTIRPWNVKKINSFWPNGFCRLQDNYKQYFDWEYHQNAWLKLIFSKSKTPSFPYIFAISEKNFFWRTAKTIHFRHFWFFFCKTAVVLSFPVKKLRNQKGQKVFDIWVKLGYS